MLCLLPVTFAFFLIMTMSGMLASYGAASLLSVAIELITLLILFLASAIFFYGEDYMYLKLASGAEIAASDIFQGFREQFLKIITAALLPSGVVLIFSVPFVLSFNSYLSEYMTHMEELTGMLFSNDMEGLSSIAASLAPVMQPVRYGIGIAGLGMLISGITFSQVYFIMADYSGLPLRAVLNENFRLLKENLPKYIYLVLSFAIWFLLAAFSCIFIVAIWAFPYFKTTCANFYLKAVRGTDGGNGFGA